MDDNELPVWMKRKESAQENTAAEPSTIVSNQKPNVKLRCIALGGAGIRMADDLIAPYKDRIPFTRIEDANQKELEISSGQPGDRLILYDRSEAQLEQVRKFVTVAKVGGRVIVCEMCGHGEPPHTASDVGADVLIRTFSREECDMAVSSLLRMIFTHGEITVDMDDFFSVFSSDDYVTASCEESTAINSWHRAAKQTAEHWWAIASAKPDSYLLSFSSSEKTMDLMMVKKASNIILDDEDDPQRVIWAVSIDDSMDDTARIVTFAGMMEPRPEISDGTGDLQKNVIYRDTIIQFVRDYVTSAHVGGNIVPPEKIPQVFVAFQMGMNGLLDESCHPSSK